MGVAIGFVSSSSINSSAETLGCESSPLSPVRSIEDGALRFRNIACEEEASFNVRHLIFIERLRWVHLSTRVHRALLISTIITPKMSSPSSKWKSMIVIKSCNRPLKIVPCHLQIKININNLTWQKSRWNVCI